MPAPSVIPKHAVERPAGAVQGLGDDRRLGVVAEHDLQILAPEPPAQLAAQVHAGEGGELPVVVMAGHAALVVAGTREGHRHTADRRFGAPARGCG